MENFTFFNPTKVIFGRDVILKLGEEVSKIGKKVLILYGQGSVKKNNVYDKAVKSLINSHITFIELGGIKSNPVLSLGSHPKPTPTFDKPISMRCPFCRLIIML